MGAQGVLAGTGELIYKPQQTGSSDPSAATYPTTCDCSTQATDGTWETIRVGFASGQEGPIPLP